MSRKAGDCYDSTGTAINCDGRCASVLLRWTSQAPHLHNHVAHAHVEWMWVCTWSMLASAERMRVGGGGDAVWAVRASGTACGLGTVCMRAGGRGLSSGAWAAGDFLLAGQYYAGGDGSEAPQSLCTDQFGLRFLAPSINFMFPSRKIFLISWVGWSAKIPGMPD